VIIDSGSPFANAESLTSDALVRGESSGIGFHFVIGNGKSLENGRVYRCPRWEGQLGASRAYGADLSDGRTIVVCLVGNSERYRMTDAQGQGAVALVDVLIKKFHIAPERVEMRVGPGLNSAQFREAIGG
jgi:hypothetical protein